jgi:hypothetical protein
MTSQQLQMMPLLLMKSNQLISATPQQLTLMTSQQALQHQNKMAER